MVRAVKVRIYPTKEQEEKLNYFCDCSRNLWNYLVEKQKENYFKHDKFGIKGFTPRNLMNEIGINIPQRIVLDVIKRFGNTLKLYEEGKCNRPKFHKKDRIKQSFRCASSRLYIKNNSVAMPSMSRGDPMTRDRILVDMKSANDIVDYVRNPMFKKINRKWFIIGEYRFEDTAANPSKNWIGIDWGVKNFITTSTGEKFNYPKSSKYKYERIKRLTSVLSKKEVGSKNFEKLAKKINIAYIKHENIKKDFIEKTGTYLCKDNNIVVEDLHGISAKGGRKFIRMVSMVSPRYLFFRRLKQKCEKYGSYYVEVDPGMTSRTCSSCGCIKENLQLKERVFVCEECGAVIDRDINAAMNIVAKGCLLHPKRP